MEHPVPPASSFGRVQAGARGPGPPPLWVTCTLRLLFTVLASAVVPIGSGMAYISSEVGAGHFKLSGGRVYSVGRGMQAIYI